MSNEDQQLEKTPYFNLDGQINDMNMAHGVGLIEKNQGQDAARLYEALQKNEYETGISNVEKKNIEYTEILTEVFPDAFTPLFNEKYKQTYQIVELKVKENEVLDSETGKLFSKMVSPRFQETIKGYLDKSVNPRIINLINNIIIYPPKLTIGFSKDGITTFWSNKNDSGVEYEIEDSLASFSREEYQALINTVAMYDAINKSHEKNKKPDMGIDEMKSIAKATKAVISKFISD